jgi:hypothetical protein
VAAQPADASGGNDVNGNDGAWIGYVRGDFNQYNLSGDPPRRQRYEAALAFLRAGAAANAARLIQSLVDEHFRGDGDFSVNHICYHWVLAILSGRSYDQLSADDLHVISMTAEMADPAKPDDELRAYNVIRKLVGCVKEQQETGKPDPRLDSLHDDYQGLLPQHRADFRRHLDPLLAEALADKLEAQITADAIAERMANGRKDRAWKFFQPTPEAPRRRVVEDPSYDFGEWVLAGTGIAIGVGAIAFDVAILQSAGVIRAILIAAAVLAGVIAVARSAIRYLTAKESLTAKERAHGHPHHVSRYSAPALDDDDAGLSDDDLDDDATDLVRQERLRRHKFIKALHRDVDRQFARHGPQGRAARRRWQIGTAGVKAMLIKEILAEYSESDLQVGAVNWLVTWRIRQLARRWKAGTFDEYREALRPRLETELVMAAGSLALAAGLVYSIIVIAGVRPAGAALAVTGLLVAGLLIANSKIDVYLVRRRLAAAGRVEAEAQHKQEQQEYRRWTDKLKDCPIDEEIVRWLDCDKIYLKDLAVNQLGLARRDILAYATLTEPAAGSVGMRAPLLPRYSRYRATVFLLTQSGVRQVSVILDFSTGDAYNQERRSFRHNAITSATVLETGIRFEAKFGQPIQAHSYWDHGKYRLTTSPRHRGSRLRATPLILRQRFRLGLENGEYIPFLVQNFDTNAFDDIAEDPAMLLNLALDTSGISGALELLEAISGHGAQWVAQRLRSRRPPPAGMSNGDGTETG